MTQNEFRYRNTLARLHVLTNNIFMYAAVQDFGSYRVLGCDIIFGRYLRTFGGLLPQISVYVAIEFSLQMPGFL